MLTQTLQEMVANLRSETGHSTSVAQGLNNENTLKYLLKRTQEELWTAFVWPELGSRADVPMVPGTYVYPYAANMPFDMVREAWAANGSSGSWSRVDYGISENKRVPGSLLNSSTGDPVQFWESDNPAAPAAAQFRVWPTPQTAGWLRMKGNRALAAFTANTDRCSIDATCILLFAASEMLARAKAEDAPAKAQKAQRHLTKLLGNQVSAKNKISTMGSMAPRFATSR